MKRYLTAAAFAAVAFAAAGSAWAVDVPAPCSTCELFPPINNVQTFSHGFVKAEVNAAIGAAVGDVKISSTAVGNNLSVDAGTGTVGVVNNVQRFAGYNDLLSSTVNISGSTATNGALQGKLTVENTAVANNASIKLGACCTSAPVINNTQEVTWDPTATTNIDLASVTGDVDVNTTSVGNNLSVEGRIAGFNNTQNVTWAPIKAITNMTIDAAGAGVTIANTAVGNNASWNLTPKVTTP